MFGKGHNSLAGRRSLALAGSFHSHFSDRCAAKQQMRSKAIASILPGAESNVSVVILERPTQCLQTCAGRAGINRPLDQTFNLSGRMLKIRERY